MKRALLLLITFISCQLFAQTVHEFHAIPRKVDGKWEALSVSNHKPVGVDSIYNDNTKVIVKLSHPVQEVYSVQVTADERLNGETSAGAAFMSPAGNGEIHLYLKQRIDIYNKGHFSYNDSTMSFDIGYNQQNRLSQSFNPITGVLTISNIEPCNGHPFLDMDIGSKFFHRQMKVEGKNSIKVKFFNADGTPMTNFSGLKFWYYRYSDNRPVPVNPNLMPDDIYGNFWLNGKYE